MTITRVDLARAAMQVSGLGLPEALEIVSDILARVSDSLSAGEPVMLSGFGKFWIVDRAPRQARNVYVGEHVMVGPRRQVRFKFAKAVSQSLNTKGSAEATSAKPPGATGPF